MLERLKIGIIRYFLKHKSPSRIPLSPPRSLNNDFYSFTVAIPLKELKNQCTDDELERVVYFTPTKTDVVNLGAIEGTLYDDVREQGDTKTLSIEQLIHNNINATLYYKGLSVSYSNASLFDLIKLYLFRKTRFIKVIRQLYILKEQVTKKYYHVKLNKRILTRYDLLEQIMLRESVLRTGRFRKSELREWVFPDYPQLDFWISNRIELILKWAIDACIKEGEIICRSLDGSSDPTYEVQGKGVNAYHVMRSKQLLITSTTKVQHQQVRLQRWLVVATVILAITSLHEVFGAELMSLINEWWMIISTKFACS